MSKRSRIAFIGNHSIFSPPFMRALAQLPHVDLVAVGTAAPGHRSALPQGALKVARSAVNASLAHLPEQLWRKLPAHTRTVARQGARVLRGGGKLVFSSNVNDPDFVQRMRKARPDLIIVAGLNQIFRAPAIEALPPMLNVHPSLLPSYRGANPAFWQIRNNEQRSGVTLHHIDVGIDSGPVVAQQEFPIAAWMNPADLMAAAAEVAVGLVPGVVNDFFAQRLATLTPGGEQSYHGFPQPDDFRLRSDFSVQEALNAIRAAAPYERLFMRVDTAFWESAKSAGETTLLREAAGEGVTKLRLGDAHPAFGVVNAPVGTLTYEACGGYRLQLRDGALSFREIQPASD